MATGVTCRLHILFFASLVYLLPSDSNIMGYKTPNSRGRLVIGFNIVFTVVPIFFVIWRLAVRYRIRPRLWVSDHLMILAVVCVLEPELSP
jgi:hypothetical protein